MAEQSYARLIRPRQFRTSLRGINRDAATPRSARAYRAESLTLWPHDEWKGRVIDALGRPIDDGGELKQRDRSRSRAGPRSRSRWSVD
jgi:flagellum-specific ATP synthase